MPSIQQRVRRIFRSRGISQCGFCPYPRILPLLETASRRRIPEGAATVIFGLFPYYTGRYPHRNLSRYAIPDDYHLLAGNLLKSCAQELSRQFPGHAFEPFVDSSPIREVYGAYQAGLGYLGENGLLIHPRFGSYVLIGELVTTLEIAPDREPMGRCLGCGECLRRCPGRALSPQGVDQQRCRSAITQKKGELLPWEQQQLRDGGFVWGCDCCNEVCPMNRAAYPSDLPLLYQNNTPVVTLDNLPQVYRRKAFNYRSKKVMERNIRLLSPEGTTPEGEERDR